MDSIFQTVMAVIFGIGIYVVLNLIPVLDLLAFPVALLGGLGAGIYLMSRSD